jgi:hypothetical protein
VIGSAITASVLLMAMGMGAACGITEGGQWAMVTSPAKATLTGVAMASVSEGWAVGAGRAILHYQAGR